MAVAALRMAGVNVRALTKSAVLRIFLALRWIRRRHARGIAQPGSAPALGAGCRGFESLYPDQQERGARSSMDRATAF